LSISEDTIHIPGIELGFKRPVLFERHAVGGEYGAGWKKAMAMGTKGATSLGHGWPTKNLQNIAKSYNIYIHIHIHNYITILYLSI
jgi:hypothetical protein